MIKMLFILFQFIILAICITIFYLVFLSISTIEITILPSYLSNLVYILTSIVISYSLIILILVLINKMARFLLKNKEGELKKAELAFWWLKETSGDIAYTLTTKLCFHSPCPDIIPRLFGFNKEKGVSLLGRLMDPEMIEIGADTLVGTGAIVSGHQIRRGKILLKKVIIGNNCTIGGYSIILPGAEIGDNVHVGALSLVPSNWKLENNSLYSGIPVKKGERVKTKNTQG